jgi:hypothetical protein
MADGTQTPPIASTPAARKSKAAPNHAAPVVTADASPAEEETLGEADVANATKDWLIVAKSVRTMLKSMPSSMHCGADALPMLNVRVQEMLTEAAARASGNSRKTLKACDF